MARLPSSPTLGVGFVFATPDIIDAAHASWLPADVPYIPGITSGSSDDITADDGGLRLIPGTHTQGFRDMCFRKRYFFDHSEDNAEICVETKAGDLTVHDGRLWHRVARSKRSGSARLRRSMFVPYLTGPYEPKDETASTPPYHTLGQAIRRVRDSASAVLSRSGLA